MVRVPKQAPRVVDARWGLGVGHLVYRCRLRLWQSKGWGWHPPTTFAEVILRLELDFYFRFERTVHFRFVLNEVMVGVLPLGVRV